MICFLAGGSIHQCILQEHFDALEYIKQGHDKRDKEYLSKRRLIARKMAFTSRRDVPFVSGMFYHAPGADHDVHRAAVSMHMLLAEDRLKAALYVLPNALHLAPDHLWPTMLDGKFVCDRAYLTTRGKRGTVLKYIGATATARVMHITPRFAADAMNITHDLLWHSSARVGAGSKWRYIENHDEFMEEVTKLIRRKRPTGAIVFLTPEEEVAFSTVKLRFTKASAVEALLQIDRAQSVAGIEHCEFNAVM